MSVLVFAEHRDGKFRKQAFELVSYASGLAGMMKSQVVALSVGDVDASELNRLSVYGANKVLTVKNDTFRVFDTMVYTGLIAGVAGSTGAVVILLANSTMGKALAPRLAVRLKAGLAPGVVALPESVNPFIVSKRVFSGNALARIEIMSARKVLTLMPNSYHLTEVNLSASVEEYTAEATTPPLTELREVQKQEGRILLTEASVVVSGGRGMKSPDNWPPLVELASLLDAATACSRPVSDEGWRPHEEHTGQTGKIIAPDLYIAVGISGATQHLAGVSSSKYIVAINNDKSAPIFEAAQYGIVGDAMKVLPRLVEAVKTAKGK